MDHGYIEQSRIADRYLARELDPEEARLFESHFVDCSECLDRLALAEIFRQHHNGTQRNELEKTPFEVIATEEHAHLLAPQEPLPQEPHRMFLVTGEGAPTPPANAEVRPDSGFAAFVSQFNGWQLLAMGTLAAILLLSIPSLTFWLHSRELARRIEEQPPTGVPAFRLQRGVETIIPLTPAAAYAVLEVEPAQKASRFRASLAVEDGRVVWTSLVPGDTPTFVLAVPSSVLKAGRAVLILQSLNASGETSESARYQLRIR
jgi:hypothetical protein